MNEKEITQKAMSLLHYLHDRTEPQPGQGPVDKREADMLVIAGEAIGLLLAAVMSNIKDMSEQEKSDFMKKYFAAAESAANHHYKQMELMC